MRGETAAFPSLVNRHDPRHRPAGSPTFSPSAVLLEGPNSCRVGPRGTTLFNFNSRQRVFVQPVSFFPHARERSEGPPGRWTIDARNAGSSASLRRRVFASTGTHFIALAFGRPPPCCLDLRRPGRRRVAHSPEIRGAALILLRKPSASGTAGEDFFERVAGGPAVPPGPWLADL